MISKYISKHLGKVITCFYAYGPLYYPLIEIDLKFFHKTCKYCRENVSTVIYFPTDMASFIIILCMYFPATPFLSCHVASECKCQFVRAFYCLPLLLLSAIQGQLSSCPVPVRVSSPLAVAAWVSPTKATKFPWQAFSKVAS